MSLSTTPVGSEIFSLVMILSFYRSSIPTSVDILTEPNDDTKPISRAPIDTNTYRVAKRKSVEKSVLKQRRSVEIPIHSNNDPQKSGNFSENPSIQVESPASELSRVSSTKESCHSKALIAPPPSPLPMDNVAAKLYEELVQQRMSCDLPPPPCVPSKSSVTNR